MIRLKQCHTYVKNRMDGGYKNVGSPRQQRPHTTINHRQIRLQMYDKIYKMHQKTANNNRQTYKTMSPWTHLKSTMMRIQWNCKYHKTSSNPRECHKFRLDHNLHEGQDEIGNQHKDCSRVSSKLTWHYLSVYKLQSMMMNMKP